MWFVPCLYWNFEPDFIILFPFTIPKQFEFYSNPHKPYNPPALSLAPDSRRCLVLYKCSTLCGLVDSTRSKKRWMFKMFLRSFETRRTQCDESNIYLHVEWTDNGRIVGWRIWSMLKFMHVVGRFVICKRLSGQCKTILWSTSLTNEDR